MSVGELSESMVVCGLVYGRAHVRGRKFRSATFTLIEAPCLVQAPRSRASRGARTSRIRGFPRKMGPPTPDVSEPTFLPLASASAPAAEAEKKTVQPTKKSEVLEFDFGGGKKAVAPPKTAGKHDRPWRKPAAAVKAEREASAKILGGSGGVHLDSLRLVMAAQELLDSSAQTDEAAHPEVQAACTKLLQVATNARPADEVQTAHSALDAALDAALETAGLANAVAKKALRPGNSATAKLQLLHEAMPRLWVGGWAALNNDCAALRERKVTHVVSVLSADQRRLPDFVRRHLYVRVDDTEEAADTLSSHFEEIVHFIEEARSAGGVVFVHCGAGISRAPTSTCAYIIWKLQMPAADAIKLVRAARPCTRPNVGFVAALKAWETKVLTGGAGPARVATAVAPAAAPGARSIAENP